MRGTTRDRNAALANAGNPPDKVLITHSWLPYSILSLLYACAAVGWFGTMIATVSYTWSSTSLGGGSNATDGQTTYVSPMSAAFFAFINLYLFRMLTLFASLAITYNAERHYLSRGAAWTSWIANTLLLFSWVATDLPFVYSTFSYYSGGTVVGQTGAAATTNTNGGNNDLTNDSMRTHFCSVSSSYWCNINYTQGVFSVFAGFLIFLTWCFACHQLKRARGVSNLLLTWPEVAMINLIVLGVIGYIIWTLSTINLGTTRMFGVFGFLESQPQLNTWRMNWSNLIWGNYLIHAAFIASLATAAYISFGATTAPRMTALITSWISFMCILPAAIYLDRNQNDIGQCDGSYGDGNFRCPSLNGVAAGMTICAAINFLMGLTMFAVLAQAETADFAIDMYGDKARAIDDARSTGTLPMKDMAAYDTTRPSTPEQAYRNTAPLAGQPMMNSNMPLARGEDVELGAPVY